MTTMSKVQLLAAQILKAETLSEAQAFARAISDAESDDEPSAKRLRPSKSPRDLHEECYSSLVTEVCKQLAKDEEAAEVKPIAFEVARDKWFSFNYRWGGGRWIGGYPNPSHPLFEVRQTMIFSDSAAVHLREGVAAPPEYTRVDVDGVDGPVYKLIRTRTIDSDDPFADIFDDPKQKISLLLDADEFATIMQSVTGPHSRGHITREVWAVCSAWAWALLGCVHDPQGMKARIENAWEFAWGPTP